MRAFLCGTALVFGIGGLALIAWQAGWITAVGVFLVVWGNNIKEQFLL